MKNRLVKMIPVVLFPLLTWLISAPAGLETETWHMFGLCLSLLCGLILKPFSEPVISLIVLGLGACFVEKPAVLYSGYAAQGVWFLLAVLLACGAFKKTGLGKRLAYILLSKFGGTKFGRSSLGLGYVMMLCDLILSPIRPVLPLYFLFSGASQSHWVLIRTRIRKSWEDIWSCWNM